MWSYDGVWWLQKLKKSFVMHDKKEEEKSCKFSLNSFFSFAKMLVFFKNINAGIAKCTSLKLNVSPHFSLDISSSFFN